MKIKTPMKLRSNIHLINRLVKEKLIREYYYYLKFKSTFVSSRLNDANRANLTRYTGFSNKTVRTYINRLLELGWAKYDNKDIVFITLKELTEMFGLSKKEQRRSCIVGIEKDDKISDIKASVALALVSWSIKAQEFAMHCSVMGNHESFMVNESYNRNSRIVTQKYQKGCLKKWRKMNKGYFTCGYGETYTHLSCTGYGRLLGLSKTSGRVLKALMIKKGMIVTESKVRLMKTFKTAELARKWLRTQSRIFFSTCSGKVYKKLSDSVSLNLLYNANK